MMAKFVISQLTVAKETKVAREFTATRNFLIYLDPHLNLLEFFF